MTNPHAPGTAAHEQEEAGYDLYPSDLPANASEYMANGWWAAHDDHANAAYLGHDNEDEPEPDDWSDDDGLTDAEADAMTLASAGWGTEEDYGYYGDDFGDY